MKQAIESRVPRAFVKLDTFVGSTVPRITKGGKKPFRLDSKINSLVKDVRRMTDNPVRVSSGVLGATVARLKMIETSLTLGKFRTPEMLVSLIDMLSDQRGENPNLTYGNLILDNRTNFAPMRTMHDGEVGKSETFFYECHASIEADLGSVIARVEEMIDLIRTGNVDAAVQKGSGIDTNLKRVLATEEDLLTNLFTDHYAHTFRNAFNATRKKMVDGEEVAEFQGASGAWSAKMPALEYLLRGSLFTDTYRYGHAKHMRYYPPQDQKMLIATRDTPERSLSYLYQRLDSSEKEKLMPLLSTLHDFFVEFRGKHKGMVEKHLVTPLSSEFKGTGKGAGALTFLAEMREMGTALKPWLTPEEGALALTELRKK